MLLKGTKIFAEINLADRVLLSAGTQHSNRVNTITYNHKKVYTPIGEWRLPTKAEHKNLFLQWNDATEYQQISVVKMPDALIKKIEKAKIAACASREDVFAIAETEYWNSECLPPLCNYIQGFLTTDEEPEMHRFFVGLPNLEMVTQDKHDEYTGLHLDSWEAADTLTERTQSRNRICFNLGKEPRYLLVLNLNLRQVFDYMYPKNAIHKEPDYAALLRNEYVHVLEFLHDNPTYPITKIKINPYEAYIAPTENMLHDGSTSGNTAIDIHLTFRAHFQYKPNFQQRLSKFFV